MKTNETIKNTTTYALGCMPIVDESTLFFFDKNLGQYDDKLVPYTTGRVCYKQDNETMEWVVMAQNSEGMCEELSRELCPVCAIVKATKKARFGITWYYILEEAEEIIEEAEQELWAA